MINRPGDFGPAPGVSQETHEQVLRESQARWDAAQPPRSYNWRGWLALVFVSCVALAAQYSFR